MIVMAFVERRSDGGVKVWSEDLPGLILSGKDRTKVLAAIDPAVKALLGHKGKMPACLRIDVTFIREGRDER
jgi:hypothetical protein